MKVVALLLSAFLTHSLAVRVHDKDEASISFSEVRASVGAHGSLQLHTTSFDATLEKKLSLEDDGFLQFFTPRLFVLENVERLPVFVKPKNWFSMSLKEMEAFTKGWKTAIEDVKIWRAKDKGGEFEERWSLQNAFNYDAHRVVFFGSLFSNMFPVIVQFSVPAGVSFSSLIPDSPMKFLCTEHWMMFWKAVVFGADDAALQTYASVNPKEMQQIGRSIKNFNDRIWSGPAVAGDVTTSLKYRIVLVGNYLKYSTNEMLKKKLLATGHRDIYEANPHDADWGIGLDPYDEAAYNSATHFKGPVKLFMKRHADLKKDLENPEKRDKAERELSAMTGIRIPSGASPIETDFDHPNQSGSKLVSYTPFNLLGKILMTVRHHLSERTVPQEASTLMHEISALYTQHAPRPME